MSSTISRPAPASHPQEAAPQSAPAIAAAGAAVDEVASTPRPWWRRLWTWVAVLLSVVAVAGAVLSFQSLYTYALPTFGPYLAVAVPVAVDFLVAGASLAYIAGAREGRPEVGWRLIAHAAVAGTIVLNALAAGDMAHVPLHVAGPLVWSVLVEKTAKTLLRGYRLRHDLPVDRIPLALWLTAPVESFRTLLLMHRTRRRSAGQARLELGRLAAANEVLRIGLASLDDLPSRRRVRRILRQQLRAGSMMPSAALTAVGLANRHELDPSRSTRDSLLEALRLVLLAGQPAGAATDAAPETQRLATAAPPPLTGSSPVAPALEDITPRGTGPAAAQGEEPTEEASSGRSRERLATSSAAAATSASGGVPTPDARAAASPAASGPNRGESSVPPQEYLDLDLAPLTKRGIYQRTLELVEQHTGGLDATVARAWCAARGVQVDNSELYSVRRQILRTREEAGPVTTPVPADASPRRLPEQAALEGPQPPPAAVELDEPGIGERPHLTAVTG